MIKAENIHKSYGELEVLKGVSLHIKKSEIVAIVGPSGAGKTTLLQILGTLDKPSSSKSIFINDTNIQSLEINISVSFFSFTNYYLNLQL